MTTIDPSSEYARQTFHYLLRFGLLSSKNYDPNMNDVECQLMKVFDKKVQ